MTEPIRVPGENRATNPTLATYPLLPITSYSSVYVHCTVHCTVNCMLFHCADKPYFLILVLKIPFFLWAKSWGGLPPLPGNIYSSTQCLCTTYMPSLPRDSILRPTNSPLPLHF